MIKKLPKFENFTKMDLTAAGLRAAIRKIIFPINWVTSSVTSKKLPNVYKSCLKMISLEK